METPKAAVKDSGLLILTIALAIFMASLDGTIVNIALPAITAAFDISTSTVSWVATSYLLVEMGCVLIFGKIADTYGYRKIFLTGFAVFTAGSFLCGFLPGIILGFPALVISRVIQAVGGAMLMSCAAAMITAFIPADRTGKAMSVIMLCSGLGAAMGPFFGGLLTQYLSWQWIFFINVPIGIVAVLLGTRVIPTTQKLAPAGAFDTKGAGLIFVGLASFVFVISEGAVVGWTAPVILVGAAVAVIALAGFVWHERGVADPMLDLGLFRNRNFLLVNLLLALVFISYAGIEYLLPFYLQIVQNYDAATAGMVLTSLSVPMMIAGLIAGMAFNRFGPRRLCIAAGIPLVIGYYMLTTLGVSTPIEFISLSLGLIGFGFGLIVTPATTLAMISVEKRKAGMISSLTSLERSAPISIGIAIYNLILIEGIILIAKYNEVTTQSPAHIQKEVFSVGFTVGFWVSLALGIVIIIIALVIKEEIHPDYAEEAKLLSYRDAP
jgi:EmrB/QacA subfamily drug resistance transporter